MMKTETINKAYEAAKEVYALYGIDTEAALKQLADIELSLHCWQGDDVAGLESSGGGVSGGIMATGQFPGKPRNGDELRNDLDEALKLLPGKQKVNLHASYAELDGEDLGRDQYETRHFQKWIDWAKNKGIGLDFNPTCFGHELASDDLTLSHPDERVRRFWIDHCKVSRKIAADIGKALGKPCICNIWVPDGMKDMPADRMRYRKLLKDSLDEILAEKYDADVLIDAVECKLFGVGVESYTVGSHEFYMGYLAHAHAQGNTDLILTLDMGHFHPTETIADKISSLLTFYPKLLIHVSRPVKWDSDHVVVSDESVQDVMREIKRADAFDRMYLATDFFDGSINRISAWVVGLRATRRAVLAALLEPTAMIKKAENEKNYSDRLVLIEESRNLPYNAVWNKFCVNQGVPAGSDYLNDLHKYERDVLQKRA